MTRKLIITGGAGFIGCHTASYFAKKGYEVVIIDNLSRKGSLDNLNWLKKQHPIIHYNTNIQDEKALEKARSFLIVRTWGIRQAKVREFYA